MSKSKTTKMTFSKSMYYNDLQNPLYVAGPVYDVPNEMVERWIKRGGVVVGDVAVDVPTPAKHEPPEGEYTFPAEPPQVEEPPVEEPPKEEVKEEVEAPKEKGKKNK